MEVKTPPPYSSSRRSTSSPIDLNEDSGASSSLYPYLHILRNRKGILVASLLFTLSIAFFINLTQKPVYQASVELLLQPKESKTSAPSTGPTNLLQDPTILMTEFRVMRGPQLAQRVLEKLEKPENRDSLLECFSIHPSRKRKENGVFSEREKAALAGAIQRSISPSQVERGARLIDISVDGYHPEMVTKLANVAGETYIEMNYSSHMEAFRQSFQMISKSLAEIREKIKTGEIASQKINSEVQLLEALKIYGEKYPLVIQLRSDIPALVQKLKQGVDNLGTMEVGQRKDLIPLLLRPTLTLPDLQAIESDLYTLKPILEQEVNTNREMYNSIFKRLQEVEVSGGGVWMDAKMVEPAHVPSSPIRPNKKLNLIIGFLVGLFLGIGLAFFKEYLDSSIRSLEDVKGYLKLFPLGMIPQVEITVTAEGEGQSDNLEQGPEVSRHFWLANDNNIPLYVAEAYRIIRTNLAFGSVDTAIKVLQVTSAVKGEGKTTTAANLAVSLALAGSRTLLIDADMRRPAIHQILGLEGIEGGLSESLANGKSWESLMVPTSVPNLFFLSAGTIPPNPSELLSSKKMKALLEELKENFDTVIIDSPPIISVADSAIIASRVDGTIFVSRSGFIPRHLCLQAKSAIESVNGKIVGCVLNGVLTEHQPYYYHHYSHYYGGKDTAKSTGKKADEGLSTTLEKVKILKEPIFVFLSGSWNRFMQQLGWNDQPKKESKSSVDSA